MTPPDLVQAIVAIAEAAKLPAKLVTAIVQVESAGNPSAWKVEPAYRYLWDVAANKPFRKVMAEEGASESAPRDFPFLAISSRDTEWWGQQASWGPMQIMGAVAREYGFRGHFPALCSPAGIKYGCEHLARLATRYLPVHGMEGVVAAYNAGSPRHLPGGRWENQEYVDKVRAAGGLA